MDAIKIVNLVLDCLLVGMMAFIIIRNCVNGFIKSLVSLLKTFAAPLIAVVFNLPLARLISKICFNNMAVDFVKGWLLSTSTVEIDGVLHYEVYKPLDGVPTMIQQFILNAGEDDWGGRNLVIKHISGSEGVAPEPASAEIVDELSEFLGARLSLGISIIVSFVVLFIVAEVFFIIIDKLSKKIIEKAKMVKYANWILGGIIGVVIAYVLACSLCVGVEKIFAFGQHYYGDTVFNNAYIDGTLIMDFFIDNNMWDFIFDKFHIS
jgi:uncharacterized membrane protein required for colicin V production